MYSYDGKRFVNQVLAGKEQALGSHIVLGLNIVNGASLDGSAAPTTHNRYHSPYIVDEIQIVNSSVVSGATSDEIVFSGQANAAKRYIANNVGLAVLRSSGAARTMRTIANVVNTTWNSTGTDLKRPTGTTEFSNDGVLEIASGAVASFVEPFSLYGNGLDDIIAFPLYFVNGTGETRTITADPQGCDITMKIRYTVDGAEKYAEYTQTVDSISGETWGLSGDSGRNYIDSTGTLANPRPFVFQRRISQTSATSAGTTALTMLNNGKNIIGVDVSFVNGTANFMRFGSIKLTPDFEADTSRTTVAFRKLATPLYKTDSEVYVNAEYRVRGVV
jgi:hypothetical protein